MANIQLLEPLTLTCSVDPSVTTSGVVSYQWTIGCSGGGCSWSGMTMADLTNPYIRGRDYGDYTCTVTEDSAVIGMSAFTIDRIEGECDVFINYKSVKNRVQIVIGDFLKQKFLNNYIPYT